MVVKKPLGQSLLCHCIVYKLFRFVPLDSVRSDNNHGRQDNASLGETPYLELESWLKRSRSYWRDSSLSGHQSGSSFHSVYIFHLLSIQARPGKVELRVNEELKY